MFYTQPDTLKDSTGITAITVASQATVYTKAHKIGAMSASSLAIALASANGTPNVKVEMQVSDTAPSALEGVVDTVGLDWCIQEGGSPIFPALADKVLHKITINPVVSVYLRLKLTGNAGNQTDTVVTARIVKQEQLGR